MIFLKLIIAEKKELAQAISDAIPGHCSQTSPYIVKGDYALTWCSGHLLALKEPEDFDESYKEWKKEQLPIFFSDWGMKIGKVPKGSKQNKAERVKLIGELLKQCDMVIHAGDCDDEGQLIVDEILRWHNYTGPVKRLDTSDTTEARLKKALASMVDNDDALQREGWVAYARSVSDALVGFNVTRAMTISNGTLLPIGRVQTPTLGLVVQREKLITEHKKIMYYVITAPTDVDGKTVPAKYEPDPKDPQLDDGRITDKAYAQKIAKTLENRQHPSIKISKKKVSEGPPLPFNMVKLQVYCSSHFGYDDVMSITQTLRDKYKAITYNRSDCQYLGDEHFMQAPDTMKYVLSNTGINPAGLDTSIRSKCFDQSKITAHFAIIPTANNVDLSQMTEPERNVYLAIAKRYMMQFMPPAQKERTNLLIELSEGGTLKAVSTEILSPGFLILEKELAGDDEKSALSQIAAGEYKGTSHDPKIDAKETKPPSRYTIATLCEDMTRIAKYVTDPKAKRLLIEKDRDKDNENGSIGTPATREAIVNNLINRGLLAQEKRNLVPTPKGIELYSVMPDEFRLADTTAKWWVVQEDIRTGNAQPDDLIHSVLDTVKAFLNRPIPKVKKTVSAEQKVVGKCPVCGGDVVERKTGFGCINFNPEQNGCKFYIAKQNPKFPPLASKTITATIAKKLLSGGTLTVKDVPKKDGKGTYTAILKISADEQGRCRWSMDLPSREPVGKCPVCGGDLIEFSKAFVCSNHKKENPESCKFVVFKENSRFPPLAKTTITAVSMKKLLAGNSLLVNNIPKKDGSGTYSAEIKLSADEEGRPKWSLHFPEIKRVPLGKCPACGGDIVESKNGFMCSNRNGKNGCQYYVPKTTDKFTPLSKHTLTVTEIKRLLSGKSIEVSNIPKKSGKGTYTALFFLEYDGTYPKWRIQFPDSPS